MIYLVTNQKTLFDSENYKIIGVEESLRLLNPLTIVGLDTETSGLDPYVDRLLSLQLGNRDFQVVVDCTTIDILTYKEYLESNRLFLGWNLKFDLKWLFRYNIIPKYVYDGFLAEKLLWLGYPPGLHSMSLKAAGEHYLNIELDKSVRGKIIWNGLKSTDTIMYAAKDVQYLEDIKNAQEIELSKKDLLVALTYENKFIFPLTYCEYCGVKLDKDRWETKIKKDKERAEKAEKACNEWLINNDPANPNIIINRQGDLFAETPFDLTPKVIINWKSTKQVIPIFKKFGVDVRVQDKQKGGEKDSIDAKTLFAQRDKCSLIPLYIKYREAVKVTDTYGYNFIKQINPVSGRIHTNYSQLGADTTRITSGGKDKGNNKEYVNLLNLPADAETRACFIAGKENKWISIDYSGQETYIMASIANDRAIIKELTEGSGDRVNVTLYSNI